MKIANLVGNYKKYKKKQINLSIFYIIQKIKEF